MTGFRLLDPPLQMRGHDAPSDPDFDPGCTFWTHDEIAILYAALNGPHTAGKATVDVGCRFGWTSRAIHLATGGRVICVDPALIMPAYLCRFELSAVPGVVATVTAAEFLESCRSAEARYGAFVIDGNHDSPEPLNDARGALAAADPDCIIFFHDFWGRPIREGVDFLIDRGFNARIYSTPNGVACCWRGFAGWTPPRHEPDPDIDVFRSLLAPEFDFSRCA